MSRQDLIAWLFLLSLAIVATLAGCASKPCLTDTECLEYAQSQGWDESTYP